jgi:hypothetical protein
MRPRARSIVSRHLQQLRLDEARIRFGADQQRKTELPSSHHSRDTSTLL